MKKITILLLTILISSCGSTQLKKNATVQDIKYFTINSRKVGTIIKKDMPNKNIVMLCYPEYIKESYSLIKYIAAIMNSYKFDGVYIPNAPIANNNKIIDIIREKAPLFGSTEFIDLYNFLEEKKIPLLSSRKNWENKLLIAIPESKYESEKKLIFNQYDKSKILKIVIAGSLYTSEIYPIIRDIPTGKKVSSVPLKNSRFKKLAKEFDITILMGEISEYRSITPIKLYTIENYLSAPKEFLESNNSILKSFQIKKMNNVLPNLIKDEKIDIDRRVRSN